jgi:hypothetical protein
VSGGEGERGVDSGTVEKRVLSISSRDSSCMSVSKDSSGVPVDASPLVRGMEEEGPVSEVDVTDCMLFSGASIGDRRASSEGPGKNAGGWLPPWVFEAVSSGVCNPVDSTTTFDDEERVFCCPAVVAAVVDTIAVNAIDYLRLV